MHKATHKTAYLLAAVASLLIFSAVLQNAEPKPQENLPWLEHTPIVQVKKELYVRHPSPGVMAGMNTYYVGPGLEREEVRWTEEKSDTPENVERRRSVDDGRHWSKFEAMPAIVRQIRGIRAEWDQGSYLYDPKARVNIGFWLFETFVHDRHNSAYRQAGYQDHLFYRISHDSQKTWGKLEMLRYEKGAPFSRNDPFRRPFLDFNNAYVGNNTVSISNGTIIHCPVMVDVPYKESNGSTSTRPIGSLCFIGRWSPNAGDYLWATSNRVWVPLTVSSRGLDESEVAELSDRQILVVWRGFNTTTTAGRKWFSISNDGGHTLSPVQELKYDDGSRFYSPSSICHMIRSEKTHKLYWIGNISSVPPDGDSPRYPLVIAEVDERIPALKRRSVTLIDNRQPGESDQLQLSNFAVLEDRRTHDLEIYLTRLGANPRDFWGSAIYKYTLRFK